MTVAELGARISSRELMEWKVFLDGASGGPGHEEGPTVAGDEDALWQKLEARYGRG